MEQRFKKCSKCGEEKLLSHFRKTRKKSMQDIVHTQYYLSKCKKCEFKERQGKKFESKAADAIGSQVITNLLGANIFVSDKNRVKGGDNGEARAQVYLWKRECCVLCTKHNMER